MPTEAERSDPLRYLIRVSVCGVPVWHMLLDPPDGFTADEVYLANIWLARVNRRTPPKDEMEWPELVETLRQGVLADIGAYAALRDAITRTPLTDKGESLTEYELAVLERALGSESHESA